MRINQLFAGALLASSLVAANVAHAVTITFDNGDTGGLSYSNLEIIGDDCCGPSGYANGNVSPSEELFNPNGDPGSFSSGSAFELNSFYLTAAWNDGLNVLVTGLLGGVTVDSTVLTVSTDGPTLETFNWSNIDEVDFSSSGGVNHGYPLGGTHFVIDNLTIDGGAVPEPATWALALTGFGIAGAALRRRRMQAITA